MFCSTYLMAFLLMHMAQRGSTVVQPQECDITTKLSNKRLDVERFAGKPKIIVLFDMEYTCTVSFHIGTWYQRAVTTYVPRYTNLTSYVLDITSVEIARYTVLIMNSKRSYSGYRYCSNIVWTCVLLRSSCTAVGRDHAFQLIAIDYDRIFAAWSESKENGEMYKILSLFTREPFSKLDTTPIRNRLKRFCGKRAIDPDSGFYARKLQYSNSPCMD